MKSLINIDHSDKTFRVVTTHRGTLTVLVVVYLLSSGLKGTLTCSPDEKAVARAISRLKSSMTHTKDPLANQYKPEKAKVANYSGRPKPKKRSLV